MADGELGDEEARAQPDCPDSREQVWEALDAHQRHGDRKVGEEFEVKTFVFIFIVNLQRRHFEVRTVVFSLSNFREGKKSKHHHAGLRQKRVHRKNNNLSKYRELKAKKQKQKKNIRVSNIFVVYGWK